MSDLKALCRERAAAYGALRQTSVTAIALDRAAAHIAALETQLAEANKRLALKSAPVSGEERWAMLGMYGSSLNAGAGHIATTRDHHCGDFKDDFDWSSLPLTYRARVGAILQQKEPSQ